MRPTLALLSIALLCPAIASAGEPARKVALSVPAGFVEMSVSGVLTIDDGPFVLLQDKDQKQHVPIMVGASEALAIQLRLDRRHFERPLTHDLFDSVMQGLGGTIVKVHVEDLKDSVYMATLFVRVGDKVVAFDARPSDSIALAVGNGAPIYVNQKVIDKVASMTPEPKPSRPSGITTM